MKLLLSSGFISILVIAFCAMYEYPVQGQIVADESTNASILGVESVLSLEKERYDVVQHTASRAVRPNYQYAAQLRRLTESRKQARLARQTEQQWKATLIQPSPVVTQEQWVPSTFLAALDKEDITTQHKEIANTVLMSLPSRCRNTLEHFYVKYEPQKHRGLAGKSVMILDGTVPDEEFRALFIHETGHNWDIGCTTGTPSSGKSSFSDGDEVVYNDDHSIDFYRISWITSSTKRSDSSPEDFVSGYAASDVFEDFAESFSYFILQNNAFAKRAQENEALAQKYVYIRDTYFHGSVPNIAKGLHTWEHSIPWDTTKLAYTWVENSIAQK